VNAEIEDGFSKLLAWTLITKFDSIEAEQLVLRAKVLSVLEWICVTYMYKMGLLLYVKDPTTPDSCGRKGKTPQTTPSPSAVAKQMVYEQCCNKNCLATLSPTRDFNESVEMVATYLDDWYLLDKATHRDKFLDLLRAQTTGISFGGERQGQLFLRIGAEQFPVCRDAFARAHNRGKTYYDRMVQHLKNDSQPDQVAVGASLVASLRAKGGAYGVKLNNEDFSAMNVGKTITSIRTVIWMEAHFNLVGDHVPNSRNGEIHLEKQEIKGIFREYKDEFNAGETMLLLMLLLFFVINYVIVVVLIFVCRWPLIRIVWTLFPALERMFSSSEDKIVQASVRKVLHVLVALLSEKQVQRSQTTYPRQRAACPPQGHVLQGADVVLQACRTGQHFARAFLV
jgi:hypothetical protein